MNSDTLDLRGERRGPTRRGRCRGTAAAVECPLQPLCKGRGMRCVQPELPGPAAARSRRLIVGTREREREPQQLINGGVLKPSI
jgi:hypothetical protein